MEFYCTIVYIVSMVYVHIYTNNSIHIMHHHKYLNLFLLCVRSEDDGIIVAMKGTLN